MSAVSLPFPPQGTVAPSDLPLDQWVAQQSNWYLALGTERGLLVAEALQGLAREVRCCSTPGKSLTVEEFYDRRPCLEVEADGVEWPPRGSWVDRQWYATAD